MSLPYIPHTEEDRKEMLATIGVGSIDDLFREIPDNLRLKGELNIPSSLDEHHLLAKLASMGRQNKQMLNDAVCFLGAGIYDRYVPATVNAIISRGEFLTAYTPYQPELSQGYLQAIYEFQSMVAELFGMDVANASMYDGATAMAEAAILAHGANGRTKVVVSEAVHPHYREVLGTYCWSTSLTVESIPAPEGVTTDYSKVDSETACVIVQYPNFFGTIEDLALARDAARNAGAMFVVVADPIACALLKPPGEYDADIVVGEGQPMGISMGFGGPLCGLFSCKESLVRRIPGRIVGRTTEAHGDKIGYVMTLRTREQDIRREKATSNICTNEALMALCATVYMEALGKTGMQVIAKNSVQNTQYAIQKLTEAGAKLRFKGKVFDEFVLELPVDPTEVQTQLLHQKVLAGLPLGFYYPSLKNCLLVAVTETRTKDQIDDFAAKLKAVLS
ncbi:MAG TPA: aminomethyl-transferring glycine dehydrogenase subunit GcvPA [Fimbriimonadaceae bacterium]|nr:aminomethyl-transferring glycine dehydrogenase subunit GcvPA [Fimbriimonadaceae bacterium]